MRHRTILLTVAILGAACRPSDDRAADRGAPASLAVHPSQRAMLRVIGSDTVSDSARVTRVMPEHDGTSVPFLFADPASHVGAGLAITGDQAQGTQLLWPDSVRDVWWSGPHALAFTTQTGRGVHVVVDVHAATLTVAEQADAGAAPPAPDTVAAPELRARAQRYVDSLHAQPGGTPSPGSSLRYQVGRITVDPTGKLAAFHVGALDPSGARSNPTWFVLDVPGGAIARIDGIIGRADEMAEDAGGWTDQGHFIYAKGLTLWDAHVAARR